MSFIEKLKGSNEIVLKKYQGEDLELNTENQNLKDESPSEDYINICFLDLETTGTNKKDDKIIEIAMKTIRVNKHTGKECTVVDAYESFEDPGEPIDPMASKFNGITDDMVQGHAIDWGRVKEVYEKSHLAVAHNSYFDRAFMDRYIEHRIPWGCSLNDIDWLERGFTNSKLELLCIWHGYFFGAHRAMNDVDALIHLMIHEEYDENKPIVELINNARKPNFKVLLSFPYDKAVIDKVKELGVYRWSPEDRKWWTMCREWEEVAEVTKDLPTGVSHEAIKINAYDKYKNN